MAKPSLSFDAGPLPADAATIDMLARLQLAADRRGASIRFLNASPDLRRLSEFVGLANVLRFEPRR
jgi:hypothetical protein